MKKTAVTFVLLCGLTVVLRQEGLFPAASADDAVPSSEPEPAPGPEDGHPQEPMPEAAETRELGAPPSSTEAAPSSSPTLPTTLPETATTPTFKPTPAAPAADEAAAAAASGFCRGGGAWRLEWSDNFQGDRLDSTYWQIVTSQGGYKDINFGVAGLNITACRCAACRESNVRVQDGQLQLHSERDPADATRYYSAAVTTKDRIAWSTVDGSFRVCVRARLPLNTRGVWPAHWMLPQNGYSDKCLDEGEMDIMEMVTGDGVSYNAYHWLSSWPGARCGNFDKFHKSVSSARKVAGYHTDFHEYAVERTGSQIQYAIDGNIIGSFSESKNRFKLSRSPFFLILNTAVGGGWPGYPTEDKTKMPVEHTIDWVRVLRKTDASP